MIWDSGARECLVSGGWYLARSVQSIQSHADTEGTMHVLYDLLYARMSDDIAESTGLMVDESLTWAEIADLHIEVVS